MKFSCFTFLLLCHASSGFTQNTSSRRTTTTVLPVAMDARMFETNSEPTTFREAELLGLRLMKEGNYEEAISVFQGGMKLPGSRKDVIRTSALKGPSPVGGSMGGYESQTVYQLDEFEMQGAHYNMACAYSHLEKIDMAIVNLEKAFENGFNNYKIVRGDPDLVNLKGTQELNDLLEQWDIKSNKNIQLPDFEFKSPQFDFNPFAGLFDNKNQGEQSSFKLPELPKIPELPKLF